MGKVIGVTLFYYAVLQLFAAITMFFSGFDFKLPSDGSVSVYYPLYFCLQLAIHITAILIHEYVRKEYRLRN